MKILDTTFLIDLQRERRRQTSGPAHQYLARYSDTAFSISIITVIEYEEGIPDEELAAARRFLSVFPVLEVDLPVARLVGRLRRSLRTRGQLIGDHDLLIAATALAHRATLLTDNVSHFARIAELEVERYPI